MLKMHKIVYQQMLVAGITICKDQDWDIDRVIRYADSHLISLPNNKEAIDNDFKEKHYYTNKTSTANKRNTSSVILKTFDARGPNNQTLQH